MTWITDPSRTVSQGGAVITNDYGSVAGKKREKSRGAGGVRRETRIIWTSQGDSWFGTRQESRLPSKYDARISDFDAYVRALWDGHVRV